MAVLSTHSSFMSTTPAMNSLEELQIKLACSELIIRAVSCADKHDARGFADCFALDASLSRPGGQPIVGREAIFATYAQRPAERLTRHLITNTLLDIVSAQQVKAVSYAMVVAGSNNDELTPKGRKASSCQIGEFHDTLMLTNEGWKIQMRDASFTLYLP